MTEGQRDILIEKMIDAPSSLTDGELDMIVHDSELRAIYETSSAVSGAYARQQRIDAEDEWRRFRRRIVRRPSPVRWIMRVAAIFFGVAFIGGVVGMLVDRLLVTPDKQLVCDGTIHESPRVEDQNHLIEDSCGDNAATPEVRTARPRRVSRIKMDEDLLASLDLPNDTVIEEYMRIHQARIDNELAIHNAEVIIDEFTAIRQMTDFAGVSDEIMESEINMITMQ